MAVDERAHRHLADRLVDVLGQDATDTLMAELGSLGRGQVATQHDMQLGFTKVEASMERLRGEVRTEMMGLRAELKTDIASVRGDMMDLRAELKTDIASVRGDIALQTRQLGLWSLGAMTGLAGIVFAAAQL